MPGKDGLLHVSEMDWARVENPEDFVKEGEEMEVKLIGIDDKTGKLKLSRKVLVPKPEGYVERPPRRDNRSRDGRDNRGGGRDRRDNRGRDRRDNRRDNNFRGPRRDNNN